MRSIFSVSTWTWALAGCLALSLGCKQGEGDRCEIDADCKGDLKCFAGATPHDGTCRPPLGSGAGGSTGQITGADTSTTTSFATSTDTSVSTLADASVGTDASADISMDAAADTSADTSTTDAAPAPADAEPDAELASSDATLVD